MLRKIIHIDMDAFFASVEQRDDPSLRGKPVAVGGKGRRGVVAAASYEARRFGVHSAMPGSIAARKCPDLIFVRPRFEAYSAESRRIREIFHEYTDLVEPLSLDEAYLDVTHNKKGIRSASKIAMEIKQQIKETTGLTASAGVSMNKFLAKVASDLEKPDGFALITPEQAEAFVENLPIGKFYGIGEVTATKMKSRGIHSGKDLKRYSLPQLISMFGKSGPYYYDIVRGIDHREVKPHRIRKSIGAERTFEFDLEDAVRMQEALEQICDKLLFRMQEKEASGKTLTIKYRFPDFTTHTVSHTAALPFSAGEGDILKRQALQMLQAAAPAAVRLLGVTLSNLIDPSKGVQLTLEF